MKNVMLALAALTVVFSLAGCPTTDTGANSSAGSTSTSSAAK